MTMKTSECLGEVRVTPMHPYSRRRLLSRQEIRHRIAMWETFNPQYFAWLKKRYGTPKRK